MFQHHFKEKIFKRKLFNRKQTLHRSGFTRTDKDPNVDRRKA